METQMNLPLNESKPRYRRKVRVAIDSKCPVSGVPAGLYLTIVNAKLFYQVQTKEALPTRDGFYGTIWQAATGDYRGVAWYETKTGIWWDVDAGQEIDPAVITSWYGLTAELGGRQRRKLLLDVE